MGLYCAYKSALHSLTQAFRAELQKRKYKSVWSFAQDQLIQIWQKGKICEKVQLLDIVSNIIDGIKNEEFEIYPDDFSKMVKEKTKRW